MAKTTPGPIGLEPDSFAARPAPRGPGLDERPQQSFVGTVVQGPLGLADTFLDLEREQLNFQNLARPSKTQHQTLSPVQYADLFHHVDVGYIDQRTGMAHHVTIDVHVYNNNGLADCRANMSEKAALVAGIRRDLKRAGGLGLIDVEKDHKYEIAHCFFGKGNPDEFRTTLMHALRYKRANPSTLQTYCDQEAKLGVDCSGFVNTYFEHIGRITSHQLISAYERGTLRSSANDIKDLDVLIWQGGTSNHIAVIDHVIAGTNPLKMIVVESSKSKHGLTSSEYTVLDVNGKIFKVDRGAGTRKPSLVKIAKV